MVVKRIVAYMIHTCRWKHSPAPEKEVTTPWNRYTISSPTTKIIKRASDQFARWTNELRKLGLEFEEGDAIPYWNILSAIYTLTEEENVRVRATEAYEFSGYSAVTGKRKLASLIRAHLVLTVENPARRNEKFVTVSDGVMKAVLTTLDSWAENYEADTIAYRKHRQSGRG